MSALSEAELAGRATAGRTKRERTRQDILDAARQLFAERSYSDVRVMDIAKAAGVGIATFYTVYGQKAAVVAELFSSIYEPVQGATQQQLREQRTAAIAHDLAHAPIGNNGTTQFLLAEHLVRLARVVNGNPALADAYLQALRVDGLSSSTPAEGLEPLFAVADAVTTILNYGREHGELDEALIAADLGRIITVSLIERAAANGDDPAEAGTRTAQLFLRGLSRDPNSTLGGKHDA